MADSADLINHVLITTHSLVVGLLDYEIDGVGDFRIILATMD